MFVWSFIKRMLTPKHDYSSLKTVTFGDESCCDVQHRGLYHFDCADLCVWGAFTGSKLLPGFLHVPGPFEGEATFTYTSTCRMAD